MHMNPTVFVDESVALLDQSLETLSRLVKTCCQPQRSEPMNAVIEGITRAASALKESIDVAHLQQSKELLTSSGSRLGELYVSCCTQTRETMYRELFSHLNQAYLSLDRALGTGH